MRRQKPRLLTDLAVVAFLGLTLSFVFNPERLPNVSLCWFRRLTGLPCPGCGLSRGFCAISHGRFADAWDFNPFSFLFYPACLAVIILRCLHRRFPGLAARLFGWRGIAAAVPLLIFALYVFGLCRLMI